MNFLLYWYGLRIINLVQNAVKEQGIFCYVDYGTLLGIFREGRTLPHDVDVDFSVCALTEKQAMPLIRDLECKGFVFERGVVLDDLIYKLVFRYNNIVVDFFGWRYEGSIQIREHIEPIGNGSAGYECHEFQLPAVKQHMKVQARHVTVNIPSIVDEILTIEYGNWRIPDKEWASKHSRTLDYRGLSNHCVELVSEKRSIEYFSRRVC